MTQSKSDQPDQSYLYGMHAVESVLIHQPQRVVRLFVLQDRQDIKIERLVKLASDHSVQIEDVPRIQLARLAQEGVHQGIVALCSKAQSYTETDLPRLLKNISQTPFLLFLDGIKDPQNLGACFRSADAAGVQLIIAPKDKSASLTPIVSKVASGAVETIPFVQVTNLVRSMEMVKEKGIWIYGAAEEAENSLYQAQLKGPVALALGAEGTGLRRLTREHCDGLVKIPMHGSVSCLNVAVATGIFLFEVVRQRNNA